MAESAIIVPVPEVEFFVGSLREKFDPSARLGVPAHITLLYPFVRPDQLSASVIADVREFASRCSAFAYSFRSTGRFENTLYLAPDPPHPFVDVINGIVACFPDYPPYSGEFDSIVPHLTVAHGAGLPFDKLDAELMSQNILEAGIEARCDMLVLIENSSGRWLERDRFHLAANVT